MDHSDLFIFFLPLSPVGVYVYDSCFVQACVGIICIWRITAFAFSLLEWASRIEITNKYLKIFCKQVVGEGHWFATQLVVSPPCLEVEGAAESGYFCFVLYRCQNQLFLNLVAIRLWICVWKSDFSILSTDFITIRVCLYYVLLFVLKWIASLLW